MHENITETCQDQKGLPTRIPSRTSESFAAQTRASLTRSLTLAALSRKAGEGLLCPQTLALRFHMTPMLRYGGREAPLGLRLR
ncbi:hypothetical protein CWS72_16760 [Telmatospirillum siberiense]|uniref:Uncharacterized protein n=1 Tax=Telmatospirillum siberiense TaxID=382514 RepID=A0A2N3PSC2_9PROT|nr:hypothetical protein CWS72_16760 [Telmatospirillum siberiense]